MPYPPPTIPSSLSIKERRTIDPRALAENHDRMLLDIAYWLDACDGVSYGFFTKKLWDLKREMQEISTSTDRS